MVFGSLLLIMGLISMVTPIPGGTLLIAIGSGMIICSSITAAKFIQACRTKFNRFNTAMTWLENKMGDRFGEPLRRTRPGALISTEYSRG